MSRIAARAVGWVASFLVAVLAGCAAPAPVPVVPAKAAPATTVVLLPEAGGRATQVVVSRAGEQVVLSRPYAAAHDEGSSLRATTMTPQQVQARFGSTLAALPARASRFTLYFVEGRDALTDESRQAVDRMLAEVAARPVPDVLVVGHTDAVGSHVQNDALALQRAQLIRTELIRLGVASDNIQVVARGKREPAVPTADGVAEPRNRRVEVLVR